VNRARIWSLYDGPVLVDEFPLNKSALKCVFSPNGKYATVGLVDGSVKVIAQDEPKIASLCHISRMAARASRKLQSGDLNELQTDLPFLLNAYLQYKS